MIKTYCDRCGCEVTKGVKGILFDCGNWILPLYSGSDHISVCHSCFKEIRAFATTRRNRRFWLRNTTLIGVAGRTTPTMAHQKSNRSHQNPPSEPFTSGGRGF